MAGKYRQPEGFPCGDHRHATYEGLASCIRRALRRGAAETRRELAAASPRDIRCGDHRHATYDGYVACLRRAVRRGMRGAA